MKTARFEFDELPFQTLARFGLTQEMIEDLPMRVLDELCEGRHSPVLPVRVSDENGKTVESRTRLVFYRMENGQVDVLFYPVLKSSPLDRYDREQQKQLLAGKAILADTPTEDGRHTKAFVQIDPETKQVMSVPTPIIGRNLQVLAEELHMGTAEINGMQHGDPLTSPSRWASTCTRPPASASARETSRNGGSRASANGTSTPSGCTAAG